MNQSLKKKNYLHLYHSNKRTFFRTDDTIFFSLSATTNCSCDFLTTSLFYTVIPVVKQQGNFPFLQVNRKPESDTFQQADQNIADKYKEAP